MGQAERGKRPYFAKDARRAMLLEVAARVVEQQGWGELSMMSLAEAAGVSRQLVYQHFRSTDQLISAALAHFFNGLFHRARETMLQNADNLGRRTRAVEGMMFDLPRGRARALWQVVSAYGSSSRPLARASHELRQVISELYRPFIESELPVKGAAAKYVAWMLIMAFWGIFQIYDEGEIDVEDAIQLNVWLVQRVILRTDAPPPELGLAPRKRRRRGVAPAAENEGERATMQGGGQARKRKTSPATPVV
jgi:AcrR family transcriptional regulator